MDLDETDQAILRLLREDARLSFRELARRVGVSTPTVASKVRQMEALGVIRGYRAVLAGEEQAPAPAPSAVAVACHECGGPVHGEGVHKAWPQDGARDHWFCCRHCAATFGARLETRSQGARGHR